MTSRVEGTAGEIARGLIQQDKDDDNVVRLVYALPTGELPSEFKTKEKQLMFVMKRDRTVFTGEVMSASLRRVSVGLSVAVREVP